MAETERVCRECGCTSDDACLMHAPFELDREYVGCWWVERDLCAGCMFPDHRLAGPKMDHRLVQAGTGADDAAPAGEGQDV